MDTRPGMDTPASFNNTNSEELENIRVQIPEPAARWPSGPLLPCIHFHLQASLLSQDLTEAGHINIQLSWPLCLDYLILFYLWKSVK